MAYNNFTVEEAEQKFDLVFKSNHFLPALDAVFPSDWLKETLSRTLPVARIAGSEKARSEFIIAPILMEIKRLANDEISIFSGKEFNVDKELGLNGICDFLISKSPDQVKLNAPILALVEAKKGVLGDGWGQPATQDSEEASEQSVAVCIAEMVAARKFNEIRGKPINSIYGIVTSGSLWHFLHLQENLVLFDPNEYPLSPIEELLAVLNWMVRKEPNSQ
jgi:hypothetical protein